MQAVKSQSYIKSKSILRVKLNWIHKRDSEGQSGVKIEFIFIDVMSQISKLKMDLESHEDV